MAHWRTMVQSEHFCAADLWDDAKGEYRRAMFRITKVTGGTVTGQKGRKKGLPFLTLEDVNGREQRAAFGANPTNCTTISSVLGTPDAKKWVGQWIGLYVTKVDGPEGLVDAIRVHPKPVSPETKPVAQSQRAPAPKADPAQAPASAAASPAEDLTDADKRAIELAEAEEARRASR